jgi:hypothetical protein
MLSATPLTILPNENARGLGRGFGRWFFSQTNGVLDQPVDDVLGLLDRVAEELLDLVGVRPDPVAPVVNDVPHRIGEALALRSAHAEDVLHQPEDAPASRAHP